MDRKFLKALKIEDDAVEQIMEQHGKVVNPLKTDNEKLTGDVARLENDLTAANEFKSKYEAEATAREAAETALEAEKTAHAATKTDFASKEESAAKDKILSDFIANTEAKDGKLRPDQLGLAMKVIDREAIKWEKKGDTLTIKNGDEVMAGLVAVGGFEFAKTEQKSVTAGASGQTGVSGKMNMNEFIRAGASGRLTDED